MEIGQRLKEAREKKNLTLEDVEREIRIRRKYLHALEEEQFQVLPGSVYARAFLKTYAGFLGLDVADAVETYNRNFAGMAGNEAPGTIPGENPQVKVGPARSKTRRNPLIMVGIAIIAGLLILAAYLANTMGRPLTPSDTPAPPPEQSQPVAQTTGVNLELTIGSSDCWMLVTVDGVAAFEGTMTPGQSKRFEGKDKILVKMGNAGAVTAKFNGQDVGVLGNLGEVISREFKANH